MLLRSAFETLQDRGGVSEFVPTSIKTLERLFEGGWIKNSDRISESFLDLAGGAELLSFFFNCYGLSTTWPNIAGAQSFVIYTGPTFYIRINVWMPRPKRQENSEKVGRYLSVDECHNHSYSFFTTIIFGPGYDSTFFDAPGTSDNLLPGCKIKLSNVRGVAVRSGQLLFVRKDIEFHIQHWPDDFTVSLNLVPCRPVDCSGRQYIVDETTGVVRNAINSIFAT